MQKIKSIQYLRAIAALGVVVFHAFDRCREPELGYVGAAGVDLFFIISGFIMWSITAEQKMSAAAFATGRATRIIPLYWLYTCGLSLAALCLPQAFPRLRVEWDHLFYSLFFIPHYSSSDGSLFPLFAAGWTLNYEIFFYCVFAGLLFFMPRTRFWVLLVVLAAFAIAGAFYSGSSPLLLTYTNVILLEFGAGVVIGRLWQLSHMPALNAGRVMLILGVCGFMASIIFPMPMAYRVLTWGIPAFLLVLGALALERHGRIGSSHFLEKTGDASYSIYLGHGLVLGLLAKLLPSAAGPLTVATFVAFGVVASILAGLVGYDWIERPLLAAFRTRPTGRSEAAFLPDRTATSTAIDGEARPTS